MNKKVLMIIVFIIAIGLVGICSKVEAKTGITYYTRGAMIIENTENIKIQEYDTVINTETSIVEEKILLANVAKEEVVTEIKLPLEDKELGIDVKDLEVKVNNLKINNVTKNEKGEYVFKVKINVGEGKKIEIQYSTENNLRDAKIIKYNFSNIDLNDRSIGKLKFDIVFPEEDIPLVTGVYPGHYTFDNNIVTVEYYNFTINSLTENIIIEKDTYNALLHDKEAYIESQMLFSDDASEEEKEQRIRNVYEFIKKAPEYIKNINKITTEWTGENTEFYPRFGYLKTSEFINKEFGLLDEDFDEISVVKNLVDYIMAKFHISKANYQEISVWENEYEQFNPLIVKYKINNWKENKKILDKWYGAKEIITNAVLKNKRICVEFNFEDKEIPLYEKFFTYDENDDISTVIVEEIDRWNVYKRYAYGANFYSSERRKEFLADIIYVGNYGNSIINATAKEKAEYANMINADIYIKIDLMKKEDIYENADIIGYYGKENEENAKKVFELAVETYLFKWRYPEANLIEITDDETISLLEIPSLVLYVGSYYYEDNKALATSGGFYNVAEELVTCVDFIETKESKAMIEANHSKNDRIKQMMEKKIGDLIITTDVEEYEEIEEILPVENEEIIVENDKSKENANVTDIIVLSLIGLGLIACIVIVTIDIKRKM